MGRRRKKASRSRRLSAKAGLAVLAVLALWGLAAEWFVHHPRAWLAQKSAEWPLVATAPLLWFGNPLADITDGLGWTGHDAIYEYDTEAPAGSVTFAGTPRRTGAPAPDDIQIIDRGEFKIGWSPSLRHPVWCAYHITAKARFEDGKRPSFLIDSGATGAPRPADYTNSGYDRGHMVPNHAIVSRFGDAERRKTFLMGNIAPQTPQLNRKVWRDVEHRIADLWTARYGEIWVVVGCIPSPTGEKLSGTDIDVPQQFYQIIMAQEGLDVRALAVIFPQNVPWSAWAARSIATIDEIEALTGLDFNPELPEFIQTPLEADLPSRLWPVRTQDILRLIMLRFM